jgi:hypothetical protein
MDLVVPRQQSRASRSEQVDEEEFLVLLESIETLLFTSEDDPATLDTKVLAAAMTELEERWPGAAAEIRHRVEARVGTVADGVSGPSARTPDRHGDDDVDSPHHP